MNVKRNLKQLFQDEKLAVLVLLAGQVLAAAAAFIVNLLAARVLDPTDRGDLAFALQIAYFLTVFVMMGVTRPFVAIREGGFNGELRNFFHLILPTIVMIIPITLVVSKLSPLSAKWIGYGFAAITIYVVFNALTKGVRVAYIVSRSWRFFAFNAIISQMIIIVGALILTFLKVANPAIWMLVYTTSGVPAFFMLLFAYFHKGKHVPLPKGERKEIRRQGLVLLPSDFSNTAMMRSDRLFLPILGTSADLGLYVTVATVLEMAGWPIKQWVDASLRKWGKAKKEMYAQMNKLLLKAFIFLILSSAGLGLIAFLILHFFLPKSYQPATGVIIPLAIASVIFGLTRVQQGLMVALGAPGSVSLVEIVGSITSIAMYVILIPEYGMYGAAYGSIIGYFACYLCSIVTLTRMKKRALRSSP